MSREKKYRILVINPIVASVFDRFDEQHLQARAGSGFKIEVASLKHGVETIEGEYDDALSAPYVVDKVLEAQAKHYDAAIIDCFLDPGLGAAREASDIVVVGPGEASMLMAMTLGDTFSIMSTSTEKYRRYMPTTRVRQLGLSDRFVSEWGAGITVASIPEHTNKIAAQLVSAAKEIEKQDGPDVLILGCTGLSRVADRVAQEIEIPLVDPSIAALSMTQALLLSGFKHSRRSYPKPAKKTRKIPSASFLR